MSDKVHTAVPVHDKSMKVIRAFDTLDVRCHYCCCTYVRCRRVLCVAITCPHQELWCRPLAHCCICTDTAPLMSMPHIARKGVTMRTYNALWVNLFLSARTLIDKKQGKTSVCAINVARPKLTKKIPPKELNWTNFAKNGAELSRWANNLDRTSLQVHSRFSSPYDWWCPKEFGLFQVRRNYWLNDFFRKHSIFWRSFYKKLKNVSSKLKNVSCEYDLFE